MKISKCSESEKKALIIDFLSYNYFNIYGFHTFHILSL